MEGLKFKPASNPLEPHELASIRPGLHVRLCDEYGRDWWIMATSRQRRDGTCRGRVEHGPDGYSRNESIEFNSNQPIEII